MRALTAKVHRNEKAASRTKASTVVGEHVWGGYSQKNTTPSNLRRRQPVFA